MKTPEEKQRLADHFAVPNDTMTEFLCWHEGELHQYGKELQGKIIDLTFERDELDEQYKKAVEERNDAREDITEYKKLYEDYKSRFEFYRDCFDQEQNHALKLNELNRQLEKDVENIAANNQRIVRLLAERDLEISKLKTELFNQLGVPKPQKDGSNDTPQIQG